MGMYMHMNSIWVVYVYIISVAVNLWKCYAFLYVICFSRHHKLLYVLAFIKYILLYLHMLLII